jgi:hypothetical protein
MEALDMNLFELIGFCPQKNNNTQASSYMQDIGIKTDYLGYELLANVDQLPAGQGIAELAHELLIRFGLLAVNEGVFADFSRELVDCIQGYIVRSSTNCKDQPRVLDPKYFSSMIVTNKTIVLNLEQVIKYYRVSYNYSDDSTSEATMLFRKIEYSVYMLLVATQTAILDSFGITIQEHISFLALGPGQTDKRIVFARCFAPLKFRVDYGQTWIGKPNVNYDKWLRERIIPSDVTRAPYPQDSDSMVNIVQFKEAIDDFVELCKDPKNLFETTKSRLSSQDNWDLKKTFGGVVCLLLVWKDGLAYFTWVPIFGDLFSILGNTNIGRLSGVIGLLFVTQEMEFKFSTKMLFQKENIMITLIILSIIYGAMLTI